MYTKIFHKVNCFYATCTKISDFQQLFTIFNIAFNKMLKTFQHFQQDVENFSTFSTSFQQDVENFSTFSTSFQHLCILHKSFQHCGEFLCILHKSFQQVFNTLLKTFQHFGIRNVENFCAKCTMKICFTMTVLFLGSLRSSASRCTINLFYFLLILYGVFAKEILK